MFSLLWTKYVCPSKIHVLKPSSDGDGVRRRGLEEVLRMGPPGVGLEPFFTIETSHSLATPWGHSQKELVWNPPESPHKNPTMLTLQAWLPAFRTVRNQLSMWKHGTSMVLRHSCLHRWRRFRWKGPVKASRNYVTIVLRAHLKSSPAMWPVRRGQGAEGMDDSILITSSWEWGWWKGFKNISFEFLRFHKRFHGPALLPAFCLFPPPQLCSVFTCSCSLYLQSPLKHTVTSTRPKMSLAYTGLSYCNRQYNLFSLLSTGVRYCLSLMCSPPYPLLPHS